MAFTFKPKTDSGFGTGSGVGSSTGPSGGFRPQRSSGGSGPSGGFRPQGSSGGSGSNGGFRSNGNSDPAVIQITKWALTPSFDEMVAQYKIMHVNWESNEKFKWKNRYMVLMYAGRALRSDMLRMILQLNPRYMSGAPESEDFTIFGKMVWPKVLTLPGAPNLQQLRDSITIPKIMNTMQVLIEGFSQSIFSSSNNPLALKETIFGTLMCESNPLGPEKAMEIYRYLTHEAPFAWYRPDFIVNINKITPDSDIQIFNRLQNKMCFIVSQYQSARAEFLIQLLKQANIPRAEKHDLTTKWVDLIFMKQLNKADHEMDQYFAGKNLDTLNIEMCRSILAQCDQLVDDEVARSYNPDFTMEQWISITYTKLFALLGSLYSKQIGQNEILQYVQSKIATGLAHFVTPFLQFVVQAGINVNKKAISQIHRTILSQYVSIYYANGSPMVTGKIEGALKLNKKEIGEFIVRELIPKNKPIAEPVAESVVEPVAKPAAKPAWKPKAFRFLGNVSEQVVVPIVEQVAVPIVEQVVVPVVEQIAVPVTVPVVEQVAVPVVKQFTRTPKKTFNFAALTPTFCLAPEIVQVPVKAPVEAQVEALKYQLEVPVEEAPFDIVEDESDVSDADIDVDGKILEKFEGDARLPTKATPHSRAALRDKTANIASADEKVAQNKSTSATKSAKRSAKRRAKEQAKVQAVECASSTLIQPSQVNTIGQIMVQAIAEPESESEVDDWEQRL